MKFIRNFTAFLSVPLVASAAYTLIKNFLDFAGSGANAHIPFWAGIFCYGAFQIAFFKPMRTYVFGHELTHAFAGILSGAKVKKFKVGKESGHVVLTKDNIWITLAPYFFPIYTFAIIVIYLFLGWVMDITLLYSYFLFFAGISIAFHIALTIYIINIGQPDLKVYGVFFSYILIIAVNVVVFSLLTVLVFPDEINLTNLYREMYDNIVSSYMFLYEAILQIVTAFQKT
ncbi:MAG: hypothetical protein LBL00_01815 [Endomicrobium sp.]|jgi:hypothetical protein|nr:hypothetical protein [Endomicrobium sp.]